MVVRACQSFHFFRQNTWFPENYRALSKFLYGILHSLISITKLYKKSVDKSQFCIDHASHLTVMSHDNLHLFETIINVE